ncbi:MAG: hypothetical protein AB7F41_06535 [Methylocystis sp.]|uniref:hypothetical protein n=1 Tax=Methylocystis sp. TaxID=1911079 RepID=UPI003D0EA6A6
MTKLLIAALSLGVAGIAHAAVAAPTISPARLTNADRAFVQKADDRDNDRALNDDRALDHRRGDWWGRAPSWRDTRPWRDDEWRRGPDWGNDDAGDND